MDQTHQYAANKKSKWVDEGNENYVDRHGNLTEEADRKAAREAITKKIFYL